MVKFEVLNELTLKVTAQAGDKVFSKAGAFIAGENYGNKNYQFEKLLLGPEGNPLAALGHQILRRVTGENLPIMVTKCNGDSITYYANEQQHVVVMKLQPGERLSVESENLLAFTPDCKYGVRFMGCGVVSQKGLATSTLTAQGPNALVAVLVDGNPIVVSNMQNGSTLEVDPDAMVCFIGQDPTFKLDLSWKLLLGAERGASGETYMMQWDSGRTATVIVQPNERKSGINIGMDGGSSGQRASRQENQSLGQAGQSIGNTLGQLGGMLGGQGSGHGNGGNSGLGGLGNMLGF